MANEIKLDIRIAAENGFFKDEFSPGRIQIDQAAIGSSGGVFSIGTSEEAISFTDISTEGWLWMRNLDDTNYVQWGPEDTGAMVVMGRMEAGEPAIFRIDSSVTLRLQANTAACKVLIKVLED